MPGLFPTIEQIFNLVRVEINDAFKGATNTNGEGRIFVDTWSPTITHLNEAIDQFKRDLENSGVTTNRTEVFYTSLPPINSALGLAVPNPAAQQYMSFTGFWDGLGPIDTSIKLPTDLIIPLEIGSRNSGTSLTFGRMDPAPDGLPSMYQDYTLGMYEWRGDSIYFNGSIVTNDIRIRYEAGLAQIPVTQNPSTFSTYTIGFLDSTQPLALYTAYIFCANKGPAGTGADLMARYKEAVSKICNRNTKMKQRTTYDRTPYGDTGDVFGWFG
jgi:hypothetical protein